MILLLTVEALGEEGEKKVLGLEWTQKMQARMYFLGAEYSNKGTIAVS